MSPSRPDAPSYISRQSASEESLPLHEGAKVFGWSESAWICFASPTPLKRLASAHARLANDAHMARPVCSFQTYN